MVCIKNRLSYLILYFRFTLQNVTASGKIGLVIKEDSLVPQNYDIQYKVEEVLLRVNTDFITFYTGL